MNYPREERLNAATHNEDTETIQVDQVIKMIKDRLVSVLAIYGGTTDEIHALHRHLFAFGMQGNTQKERYSPYQFDIVVCRSVSVNCIQCYLEK